MPNFEYENNLISKYPVIAGIDEAGRGPIAGPVVAAALIFHEQFFLPKLNDSKQLSEKQREELFELLTNDSRVAFGVGIVSEAKIDEINILNATYLAMERAVERLSVTPQMLLIDGNRFVSSRYAEYKTIVKGDAKCASIAAASIVAKVTRDRIMKQYHKEFPHYGFDKHKGYGTKQHFDSIKKFGKCNAHRNSFLIKFESEQKALFE
jgi:ribonuclease HII